MLRRVLFTMSVLAGSYTPRLHAQLLAKVDTQWQAVREAVTRGAPDLLAARARLDAGRSRVRLAGLVPASDLSAEFEEGGRSTRVELSRELWAGGRRSAERRVAEREADQALVELEIAERRALILADALMLRAAGSLAIATRLADADSLLSGAEEALRTRFALGTARYGDLLRLRAERIRLQSDRVASASRAREARAALLAFLPQSAGLESLARQVDDAVAAMARDTNALVFTDLPPLDSLVARAGPIRRAVARTATTSAARDVAVAGRRPSLSASFGVQRYEGATAFRLGPTVGATLALPFTSAAPRRALATAGLDLVAAEAEMVAATAGTRASLDGALERYETARERMTIYDAVLLTGAREEREAGLALYRDGDVTLLELLDFEVALTRAETERIATRMDLAAALTELLLGEDPDLAALNGGNRP